MGAGAMCARLPVCCLRICILTYVSNRFDITSRGASMSSHTAECACRTGLMRCSMQPSLSDPNPAFQRAASTRGIAWHQRHGNKHIRLERLGDVLARGVGRSRLFIGDRLHHMVGRRLRDRREMEIPRLNASRTQNAAPISELTTASTPSVATPSSARLTAR